eukprot:TRINITY_DN11681_c0_g1_i1.p1 TRINITY_DN11681_c0_g1~~TRINITY_DN11681_c0_g1_i1.p1  ORF type:complete len:376 (-),score=109.94 TRINITY_DN11681_c0_g1_i1:9-1136(-)
MNKVYQIKTALQEMAAKTRVVTAAILPRSAEATQVALKDTEKKLLSYTRVTNYEQYFVEADNHVINTLQMGKGPVLLMLHGFAGGIGFWSRNLNEISKSYTVFAIDLPGFGRNVRAPYKGKTTQEAENYFVSAIEAWRKEMNIDKFSILGHSLGGYVTSCYAERYPQHVEKIILADPFGVEEQLILENLPHLTKMKMRAVRAGSTYSLSWVRAAGPVFGPHLVERVRWDLMDKWDDRLAQDFSQELEGGKIRVSMKDVYKIDCDDTQNIRAHPLAEYIYLCNSSPIKGGEEAFQTIVFPSDGITAPLSSRLMKLPKHIPISFIYGKHSWVGTAGAHQVKKARSNVRIQTLKNSGHHLYIDDEHDFNRFVREHSAE